MNREATILGLDDTQDQLKVPKILDTRQVAESGEGVEIEAGRRTIVKEILPGEPLILVYGDTKFMLVLQKNVECNPIKFLKNNPDIYGAMRTYSEWIGNFKREGKVVPNNKLEALALNASRINQGHQRVTGIRGNTIIISTSSNLGDYLNSDPIPGATLNVPRIRTERVNIGDDNIITSVLLRISLEEGFNSDLPYDFSLLLTNPQLEAGKPDQFAAAV